MTAVNEYDLLIVPHCPITPCQWKGMPAEKIDDARAAQRIHLRNHTQDELATWVSENVGRADEHFEFYTRKRA